MIIKLPEKQQGRPYPDRVAKQQKQIAEFCAQLTELADTLDFIMTARGWCYYLEGLGAITKGEFDTAQRFINAYRKSGALPIDICAPDESRAASIPFTFDPDLRDMDEYIRDAIEDIDPPTFEYYKDYVERFDEYIDDFANVSASRYNPYKEQEFHDTYIELMVEKIDLVGVFRPVCEKYKIPYSNRKGWGDINSNAALMRRFQYWEEQGKRCVLLYCGDHDPGGLHISDAIRDNLRDLSAAVGWEPDHLIIDRFGLNYDFIEANHLMWIDNLETSGKDEKKRARRLDDKNHNDHYKPYVQDYINEYGVRKVEANALVSNITAGRQLCEDAILKYYDTSGPDKYRAAVIKVRSEVQERIQEYIDENDFEPDSQFDDL